MRGRGRRTGCGRSCRRSLRRCAALGAADRALQDLLDARQRAGRGLDRRGGGDRTRGRRLGPADRRGARRSGAGRRSAPCSPGRAARRSGSTGIRPCARTRSRRWTRPTCGCTWRGRPASGSGWSTSSRSRPAPARRRLLGRSARAQRIVALDVIDEETLAAAGRLVWESGAEFVIGSQGVEYALVAAWRAAGLLCRAGAAAAASTPAHRIVAVSGSCSPVTADQIACAEAAGFETVAADAALAVDEAAWTAECGRAADAALAALGRGRSPIVATARGPRTPRSPARRRRGGVRACRRRRSTRASVRASEGCSTACCARAGSGARRSPAATPRATARASSGCSR